MLRDKYFIYPACLEIGRNGAKFCQEINAMIVEGTKAYTISYRGYWGEKDPWQTQGGIVTEPVLHALNIPTWHLNNPNDIYRRLKDAQTLAHASLHPVAVLLSRDLMWEE